MVETPKLSSLAGELLKFFLASALLLGLLIAGALTYFGGISPYYAVAVGFSISALWVLFNILWTRNKMEELFGRLLYVIEILEERRKEKAVVPIPLHEEVLTIVNSIRELVQGFEERYEKEIKELEEELESISENAAKIHQALELAQGGYVGVEFPTGLDPVGALGQSIQHTLEIYTDKLVRVKKKLHECSEEIERISSLLKEKTDKIDLQRLEEGIERIKKVQEELTEELKFLKDYEGGT